MYFLWIFVALRILVPVNIPYMVSNGIELQWDFIQNEDILSTPASEQETVKTNINSPVSGAVLMDASAPANSISDRDSESGVNLENPSKYGHVRNSTYMNVVTEPVLLMENVVFAKCGYSSVIALTENGDVYVFGNNDYVPFSNESYYAPKKVMEHAKYVSAYYHTYAVIREDNSLWTWGYNNMGQCGNGAFSEQVATPQKVMEDVDCAWMGKVAFNSTGEMAEQDNLVIRKTDGGYYVCGAGTGADFQQAEIRQFVPLSLGNVELLWDEDELKQFLDSKQIDYYTSGRADNGYQVYMANGNEWEFVFNSVGELVSIASNQNDALEENLLRQGDAFDKVTEAYGEAYTRTDGEYNDFVIEYERENYYFRVYCYLDLGCAKFCKCIKGFDL